MGGLKLPPEKRNKLAKLTPDIASHAIKVYIDLIDEWNSYLALSGAEPVKAMQPTGSVTYCSKDLEDESSQEYGDIDYLVAIHSEFDGPEIDRRRDDARLRSKYESLFEMFLNEKQPHCVDIEETLRGSTRLMVMIKLPNDTLVQVDTVITFPRYSSWMKGRYTPQRGFKGYTIGNLYKALGDYLVMSIGTEGVIVRSISDKRVPSKFSRSKGVKTENISLDIENFLRDIALYIISKNDIEEDTLLSSNPGVDPSDIDISKFALGIKGLANTLDRYKIYSKGEMLMQISKNYKAGLKKNVENKRNRGLDDESYDKLLKLNSAVAAIVDEKFGI
jgi:hypothetical protein